MRSVGCWSTAWSLASCLVPPLGSAHQPDDDYADYNDDECDEKGRKIQTMTIMVIMNKVIMMMMMTVNIMMKRPKQEVVPVASLPVGDLLKPRRSSSSAAAASPS